MGTELAHAGTLGGAEATSPSPRSGRDPRLYQIAALCGLLVYGMGTLGFDVSASRAALILGAVLATQAACSRLAHVPFDPRSALISGLSLCLLFRSPSALLAVVASLVTIASKFALRWNGKHVWNPTNLGLVVLLLTTREAWVSPGQWGHATVFAFLMVCLGSLVVYRAERADVSVAFLAFHAALLFARASFLGDPFAIPSHQLTSGALLLFAFFMISDPKTTPDSRAGRILFAALVALGGAYVQFRLFRPNGLLWSLAACSILVPVIDRLLPGPRYTWRGSRPRDGAPEKGHPHAPSPDRFDVPGRLPALG